MNYNGFKTQRHFLRPRFSGAVRGLIVANITVFLIQLLFPRINSVLGLVPLLVIKKYFIWQLLTYMFLHGGFFHLFFNMFILWMFGSELESIWGKNEFLKYYFITGIGAGLIYVIAKHNSIIPTIGASGAIYGLLLAFGLTFPNRYIYLYFFLPVKAKFLVLILGTIEFFSAFGGSRDNIAHFAHLGGLLIGFLYLKFLKSKGRLLRKIIFVEKKGKDVDVEIDDTDFEDKVNDVLRKLSKVGLNGLTTYEKRILEEARKRYRTKM
ncbi:MAG: rhomboid family intramembrane serine protease [Candidatus Cloacimonadota bacterium]|nr:MAG: rhomboid family intramembrane serine protease [Candidatus Cloacimonadota bacterium]